MRSGSNLLSITFPALLAALLIGCQGRASIPSNAQLEQSGTGGLSYTAHQAGNVYVIDSDKDTKIFEGRMNNGDQLVLIPGQDKIVLAGNNADHKVALQPDHRYKIYFTPAS